MKARIFTKIYFRREQTIISKISIFTFGSSMNNQKTPVFYLRKSVFLYIFNLEKFIQPQ